MGNTVIVVLITLFCTHLFNFAVWMIEEQWFFGRDEITKLASSFLVSGPVYMLLFPIRLAHRRENRKIHERNVRQVELGKVYERLVDGAFRSDEQISRKAFIDYFLNDKFKKYHHIEYDKTYTYYLLWNDLPDCKAVCILAFVVDERFRNQGIGTEIIRKWFDKMGKPRIMIEVDNDRARRFWEKEGFAVADYYEHYQPSLGENKNPVKMPLAFNFDVDDKTIRKFEKSMLKYGFGKE